MRRTDPDHLLLDAWTRSVHADVSPSLIGELGDTPRLAIDREGWDWLRYVDSDGSCLAVDPATDRLFVVCGDGEPEAVCVGREGES
jgi:hypothetical protein